MSPRLRAAVIQFAIAASSMFVLVQVVKVLGGTPFLPISWQDIAMPILAAAVFVLARLNRSGTPK